jgi:Spy/CpxP family protein refolding chaperone
VRKAEEILKDSDKKIKKVLSPEQQEKYAAMEQQMREQLMERMQEAKSGGAE